MSRITEFDKRHGGREVAIMSDDGYWLLYPDGARREVNPNGVMYEPREWNPHHARPHENEDDITWENLQHRIRYYRAKLQRLAAEYNQYRQSLRGTDYSENELEELKQMKRRVHIAKADHEAMLEEQFDHPKHKRQQAVLEMQAAYQERIADKNRELDDLRI